MQEVKNFLNSSKFPVKKQVSIYVLLKANITSLATILVVRLVIFS